MAEIAPLTAAPLRPRSPDGRARQRRRPSVRRHLRRRARRARRARSAQRRAPHPARRARATRSTRTRRALLDALARARASSCATTSPRSIATTRPSVPRAPAPVARRSRGAASSRWCGSCRSRSAIVLPHERTLSGPKEDRLKLFRATRTNLSPGFMLYRDPRGELDAPLDAGRAARRVLDPGRRPSRAREGDATATPFAPSSPGVARSTLLIADGHHRYETALRYAQEVSAAHARTARARARRAPLLHDVPRQRRRPEPRRLPDAPARSLAPVVLVRRCCVSRRSGGLRGRRAARAAHRRRRSSSALRLAGQSGARASRPRRADGRVALLTLRGDADLDAHPTLGQQARRCCDGPTSRSCTRASSRHLLGITPEAQAAKTNLWYPQDAGGGARASCAEGSGQVLFLMNATPVARGRDVAEAGEVMPQKSTFFYPKVADGPRDPHARADRAVVSV